MTKPIPDFIVIGAMRAGTTTLYHHLDRHPEIGMSRMKETDFFIPSMNYPLGFEWYRSQFTEGFRIYGEVSPNYSKHDLWKGVPERIKSISPEVRLIFIARDPVDRFVSHYLHSWHVGHARVDPDALIESKNGQHMLETSRYAAQIKSFLRCLSSVQLQILVFDELRTQPQVTLDRVTTFLGVAPHPVEEIATHNDVASNSRMPGIVPRVWRSRTARKFDRFLSRETRNRARRLLSIGPRRPDPHIGPELRSAVASRLSEDAADFRELSGLSFPTWQV